MPSIVSVDVRVHVGPEARDERLELVDARQVVSSERADGLTGTGKAVFDELAGTVDRRTHLGARLLPFRQLPRALQLNRRAGERVGQDIVELARDPTALGDRRRLELLLRASSSSASNSSVVSWLARACLIR